MIINVGDIGLYLELPYLKSQTPTPVGSVVDLMYARGDMRLYPSDQLSALLAETNTVLSVTVEAVNGSYSISNTYSIGAGGWIDLSEIVLGLGVSGGLDGGDAGACGAPTPVDYEWPPVPYPYRHGDYGLTVRANVTIDGQTIEAAHTVRWDKVLDMPIHAGVAPIIDRYSDVSVLSVLDTDCYSSRVVMEVGDMWKAAGDGHQEACYYQWLVLSGRGRYGLSARCHGGLMCDSDCEPPVCPSTYDCQGVMQQVGGGGCLPNTKKRMVRIRYCNIDGLTIDRWCEVAAERVASSQSERAEARAYRQISGYWTQRIGGWYSRTRNLTTTYITVAWRGFPVAELKRIAEGITYTPTCVIIDGDKAWYAVLGESLDIDIEDGDLEIEFEVREAFKPWPSECEQNTCECDEELGCYPEYDELGNCECICPQ